MIIKEINWDGYNEATVKQIHEDGSILCDLRHVTMDGVNEVVSKSDTGISFPGDNCPFELHAGEIAFLNGEDPTDDWLKDTIILWLDLHGITYASSATKSVLLTLTQ